MDTSYFAPAKLNLFLHVTGRRADGYHTLETVFQLIDFGDTISFHVRTDGVVRRDGEVAGVPEDTDLAVRAARLLRQASGTPFGAELLIEKRIPLGAGLGGGSSDAATVLLALNRLWRVDFPRWKLMELGLSLGADVPFFVFGRNAFARGIGEDLQALELPTLWYVVLTPQVKVPTELIFQSPELTRNAKSVKMEDFSASDAGWRMSRFPEPGFRNDLAPVAKAKYPEIGTVIDWLCGACAENAAQVAVSPRMTGSGASVFAGFVDEAAARAVLARRPAGLSGFAARGLRSHPLADFAKQD